MGIDRGGESQRALDEDLAGCRVDQVAAPHHVGDPLMGVVDHHRELVGEEPVGASHHKVTDRLGDLLLALAPHQVLPVDAWPVGTQPQGTTAPPRRETGVRAIRSLVEEFLRDILFELPERTDVAKYVVSGNAYRGEEPIRCEPRVATDPPAKARRRDTA